MISLTKDVKWQVGILLSAWMAAFSPIVPEMVETWFSHSDNSHALIVPLISLYFLWDKRSELGRVPIVGSNAGVVILIVSLAVYVVSYAGGIAVFARLMLVASLIGLLWGLLGTRIVRLLAFPLGFLFFMVPVPDTLLQMVAFPLQLVATKLSAQLIGVCAIPVYREGNMLYFLQTQLEVAEACSGIRSIMALTMLSVIFAYITAGGWWRQGFLILSAIPIALAANIVRVSGTGVLAHFFGDSVARGFLHEFSGLVVFALGLLVLFLEFRLLKLVGYRRWPSNADGRGDGC